MNWNNLPKVLIFHYIIKWKTINVLISFLMLSAFSICEEKVVLASKFFLWCEKLVVLVSNVLVDFIFVKNTVALLLHYSLVLWKITGRNKSQVIDVVLTI